MPLWNVIRIDSLLHVVKRFSYALYYTHAFYGTWPYKLLGYIIGYLNKRCWSAHQLFEIMEKDILSMVCEKTQENSGYWRITSQLFKCNNVIVSSSHALHYSKYLKELKHTKDIIVASPVDPMLYRPTDQSSESIYWTVMDGIVIKRKFFALPSNESWSHWVVTNYKTTFIE